MLNLFGWAGRTDVERVQRYTEWSLNTMIWFFLVIYVLPVLPRQEGRPVVVAGTVVLVLAMGMVGTKAVKACARRWPATGVPWGAGWLRALLAVLAVAVGWAFVLSDRGHIGWPMGVAMVAAWGLGGLRSRPVHVGVLLGCFVFGAVLAERLVTGLVVAGFAAFMLFTMQSSLWLLGVVRELDRARRTASELAVAQERLRFSSDVHDVMGRHLSTIAVQSELAAALLRRGDDRAAERIEQVRASAHEALREARELARGYRPLDLTQEVEGAVALLASAGAQVRVLPEPLTSALTPTWHEAVARVVREAVTNVLRHSRAAHVSLRLNGPVLSIVNDGALATGTGDGSGLRTLAADLGARGADLTSVREGETFTLTLVLPADAVQPGRSPR